MSYNSIQLPEGNVQPASQISCAKSIPEFSRLRHLEVVFPATICGSARSLLSDV